MNKSKNKYEQIYEYLKELIASGEYKSGDILPTDNEIAAKFSASRPTVAKASARLVEEGILGRRPGYGTFILNRNNKPKTFGLLIPGLGDTEIFEPICARIAALAATNNFHLIWGGGGGAADKDRREAEELAQRFVDQKIDGVFFTPIELIDEADKINRRILRLFKQADISVVLLDADVAEPPDTSKHDLIGIDNVEAGFTVTHHLVEQGCKTIGFVNRINVARTVRQRLQGAKQAIEQSRLSPDSFSILEIHGDGTELAEQLAADNAPEGIVCYNDVTAAMLMRELIDRGIKIPEDIKIVGIDDVKYARMLTVPLTTYHQPCQDIGTAAVETMLSRLRNPKMSPMHMLLKGELVVRRSSGS